jgi:hypothetical protein
MAKLCGRKNLKTFGLPSTFLLSWFTFQMISG